MKEEDKVDTINYTNTNTNTDNFMSENENNMTKETEEKKVVKKNKENENENEIDFTDLKEKEENCCSDNKGQTLLNKNEFLPTYPQKKTFFETEYIKRVALIFIYLITYIYSAIYIRINALDLIPIKASYVQGAILSIFIPISFFISSNINFKKNKIYMSQEKEVLNEEIEKNMKEGLSDFMNRKYYEVYYYYISKFYILTAFFSVLYILSIYCFHQGISYTQPLFGQLFVPFISFIIVIMETIDHKRRKYDIFKILNLICIIIISLLFMTSYIKNNNLNKDHNYIYSITFLGVFTLCQSILIYFMNKVFQKYYYYVDVLEFVGYMGIYITVIVPLILVILYAIFYSELIQNNPSGNLLFIILGKAFISTCICDLSLAYILKYFSIKIICKLLVINLSLIYLIFYIVTGKDKILNDFYFIFGQILSLALIALLIRDIYKKNLKREVYEINKQKIRASL